MKKSWLKRNTSLIASSALLTTIFTNTLGLYNFYLQVVTAKQVGANLIPSFSSISNIENGYKTILNPENWWVLIGIGIITGILFLRMKERENS